MSTTVSRFSIRVDQVDAFEFRVKFDKGQFPELAMDEPPPLGHDRGPNASRVLAAALGNCLSASLVFCMKKQQNVALRGLQTDVEVEFVRNERKRLRIGKVNVTIHTGMPEGDPSLAACRATFEDFCVVTESVRAGIEVAVQVL